MKEARERGCTPTHIEKRGRIGGGTVKTKWPVGEGPVSTRCGKRARLPSLLGVFFSLPLLFIFYYFFFFG